MNFMPSEDTFFDEPLVDTAPAGSAYHPPEIFQNSYTSHQGVTDSCSSQLLESSLRQEKLMERMISELERMNRRLTVLESVSLNPSSHPHAHIAPVVTSPQSENKPVQQRGNFALPPGSRPTTLPHVAEKKPLVSAEDESAAREKAEQDAILRRRAEEEVRLARIEAERLEREAEEDRKRLAELKRIEDEKRMSSIESDLQRELNKLHKIKEALASRVLK